MEFTDKLAVLKEAPVQHCWLETDAKPIGTQSIDTNKGDGDRVQLRSRLVN